MAARGSKRPATFIGVLTAVGAVACSGDDDPCEDLRTFDPPPAPEPGPNAPPEVLSGEWIGSGVLELSFSKPLSPTTAPDPSRFVIMSWSALASTYYVYNGANTCQQQTSYRQLAAGGYYYYSPGLPVADVWVAPEDASILRLRMGSAGVTCPTRNGLIEAGLVLVYTNGEDPEGDVERLLDASGDPVPALGPSWAVSAWDSCALSEYSYYSCSFVLNNTYQGHLPFLDPLAPIPCP